ncbi:hypothetical protein KKE60_08685 [Patescibacteria group bacterium]|nr:hypothetical protein [Patescibacteria group bacterium]
MIQQLTAEQKIGKARAGLVLSQPFFGHLLLTKLHMGPEPTCETMRTNGRDLVYNPQYVDTLSLDECKGVLAHEVYHCVLQHTLRRGDRDPQTWNRAADYVVNAQIGRAFALPSGALQNPAYANKSTEEVYGILAEHQQDQGIQEQGGSGSGGEGQESTDPGRCGEVTDYPGEGAESATQSERAQAAADWKVALTQAAQQASAQGQLPAGIARTVDQIVNPLIDWRSVLRRFMDTCAKSDYSWVRPNRRHIAEGLYLPSLYSEELPPIVIAVDTSGSINGRILSQFAAEITAILQDFKTTAHVVYCDSEVHGVEEFTSEDLVILHPAGGGGTDFRPVFRHVEEQGITPSCLIYLTDMEGEFPEEEPAYPVLWCKTADRIPAPFGEEVLLRAEE